MIKVINLTSVPLHLARTESESNSSKSIFQRTAYNMEVPILTSIPNENLRNEYDLSHRRLSVTSKDRIMKKRNKVIKIKNEAKISKEKLRLQRSLLEHQLSNLKMEKVRLKLENEKLRLHHSHLVEKNQNLRHQWKNNQTAENPVNENTIKHAEGKGVSMGPHSLPDDSVIRNNDQVSDATLPDFSLLLEDILDMEQVCEFSNPPNFEESDVFVCSISQDMITGLSSDIGNTIARTICQEIEVSCSDDEESSNSTVPSRSPPYLDDLGSFEDIFNALPNYPEPWTFDDLFLDFYEGDCSYLGKS